MTLTPGSKIRIWTDGTRTNMEITKNGLFKEFTILSDTQIGMKCNLFYEVAEKEPVFEF